MLSGWLSEEREGEEGEQGGVDELKEMGNEMTRGIDAVMMEW